MRLAHLSDLHFGHHDPAVAAGLAADLATQRPDLVVVSGDFTQLGTAGEFAMARAFLDTLPAPLFAVPGNHDIGKQPLRRFLNPYGFYHRYIAPEIEPFLLADGVALAGLNTTRRFHLDRNWAEGTIDRAQLARLGERFAAAPTTAARIVVAHHPLMVPALPSQNPHTEVKRSALALEAFAGLGIRLVLSGHFHLSFVRRYEANAVRDGIPPGPRQAAAAPVLVAQASSTISTRLRGEPNSYNLIDIADGVITIHAREWDGGKWVTREEALVAA